MHQPSLGIWKITIQSGRMADVAADALNDQPWHPDAFPVVDPAGRVSFSCTGASAQLHEAGLEPSDIA